MTEYGKRGGRGNKTDSDATRFNDRGSAYLAAAVTKARAEKPLVEPYDRALAMEIESYCNPGSGNQHTVDVDNVNKQETPDGNSRAYTLNRLRRDAPELFNAVVAGELSANAAAIEAGFRRKPTPLETLQRAWRKASDEERAAFLIQVMAPND